MGFRGGGCGGGGGAGGGGAGLTALTGGLGAGRRDTEGRAGFADRDGRLAAAFFEAFAVLPPRAGLRLEVVRAFPARRNFAMPGG